jgi:hypothetical protein
MYDIVEMLVKAWPALVAAPRDRLRPHRRLWVMSRRAHALLVGSFDGDFEHLARNCWAGWHPPGLGHLPYALWASNASLKAAPRRACDGIISP